MLLKVLKSNCAHALDGERQCETIITYEKGDVGWKDCLGFGIM